MGISTSSVRGQKVQWFDPSLEIEVFILCLLFFDLGFFPRLSISRNIDHAIYFAFYTTIPGCRCPVFIGYLSPGLIQRCEV